MRVRKLLQILLVLVLFTAIPVASAPSICIAGATYNDCYHHWAQGAIERWSDYDIVSGDENGDFMPDASMTRAQLAKVLANLLGLIDVPKENPFSDVADNEWYTVYMLRCYDAGIMLGSDGKGNPNAPVSRQESMVMIARALGIEPINPSTISEYKDADNVDDWAAGYVAALIKNGIVDGVGDNALAPKFEINRASVMTVLDRSIGQYIKNGGVYDLTGNVGIVLVVAGDVTLTGKADANLIISPGCAGKTVSFDGATVTGTVTVQTDSCVISQNNSSLPEIKISVAESTVVEATKPEEVKAIVGGGAGGGGGGVAPSPMPTPSQGLSVAEKLEKIGLSYRAADSKATTVIKPQVVEGKAYLFLPSSADYSSIYFTVADTTELCGTVQGATLTTTASGGEKLDLNAIFGAMSPGAKYTMRAKNSVAECEIILMKGANIPSLHITLDESNMPSGYESTLAYIHADKSNKLTGNLVMVGNDGSVLEESLKQLKGRGNSSWVDSGEKRPYNIKLDKKQELISGSGAAKNWCLLSNNLGCKSGIPNTVAYKLYEDIGGNFAVATQSVDLYVNNEYRGVYFLTEKVEADAERVAITETKNNEDEENVTRIRPDVVDDVAISSGILEYQYATNSTQKKVGGYLLEIDPHGDEASWFKTKRGVMVMLKSPEFATKEQVQKIAVFFQEFEDALYSPSGINNKGKYYTDYIDVESWAKQYILDCFVVNFDFFGASSYTSIAVNDAGIFLGNLIKGPAWDYNGSNPEKTTLFVNKIGVPSARNFVWVTEFLKRGDFMMEMKSLNENIFKSNIENLVSGKLQAYIDEVELSQAMNEILWDSKFNDIAAEYLTKYSSRYDYWCSNIWANDNLLGVRISEENGSLSTNIGGTATSYQWYRCDSANADSPILIEGATAPTFTPNENGIYYVAVTGVNIGYNPYAAGHPEEYTENGKLSIVAIPVITMYSNPIEVASF